MGRRVVALVALAALLTGAGRAGAGQRATCAPVGPLPPPPVSRPHYALRIDVARGLHVVTGRLQVTFTPRIATDRLVLRLWANGVPYARAGARLTVSRVREGGRALPVTRPNPTTLVVSRQ